MDVGISGKELNPLLLGELWGRNLPPDCCEAWLSCSP